MKSLFKPKRVKKAYGLFDDARSVKNGESGKVASKAVKKTANKLFR